MTVQPVKNAPAPGYPEKRWLAAPLAVGLTIAMALGLNGCGERVTMGEAAQTPTEICATQAATTVAAQDTTTNETGAAAQEPEIAGFVTLGVPPIPVPEN